MNSKANRHQDHKLKGYMSSENSAEQQNRRDKKTGVEFVTVSTVKIVSETCFHFRMLSYFEWMNCDSIP